MVSWETNKPATTKVNFGSSSDFMPNELSNQEQHTAHRVTVQGDAVRAGRRYALRITSDDGAGPVTLDGEFITRSIPIIVKVTDPQNQPVAGATVSTDVADSTTNDSGVAELSVPEGTVSLRAKKDNLSGDVTAEITIPASDSSPPQEVPITLQQTQETAPTPAESKQGSVWPALLLIFGGIGLAVLAFFFWRRRRRGAYSTPSVTVTSSPAGTPWAHSPTLPELVRQDLAAKHKKSTAPKEEEPMDMFGALDRPAPPTPPPMPHPTEQHPPAPHPTPSAPHHTESPKPPEESPKPEHPQKHHKEAEIDPKDHTLRIYHDDE